MGIPSYYLFVDVHDACRSCILKWVSLNKFYILVGGTYRQEKSSKQLVVVYSTLALCCFSFLRVDYKN